MTENFNMGHSQQCVRYRTRGLFCLIALLILGACSSVRVGYNNAETLLMFWTGRYVDFTSEQERFIRPRLQALFAWHRSQELPAYAALASRLQQRIDPALPGQPPFTVAEVVTVLAIMQARARVLAERALPDLAEVALTLTPGQIQQIERKMADNLSEYERKILDGSKAERRQRRLERTVERAEEWFGRYNSAQRRQILAAAEGLMPSHERSLVNWRNRQRDLIQRLRTIQREQPSREQTAVMLAGHINLLLTPGTADATSESSQSAWSGNPGLTALLVNIATPDQRQRAMRRLAGWASDFNQLSAQALAQRPQ